MKEFKSKYPKDSKEYLLLFILQSPHDDLDIYVHGKKVDGIENINLDNLSYTERCCVLMKHIIDDKEKDKKDYLDLGKKYKKEFSTMKSIVDKIQHSNIVFDEERERIERIIIYDGVNSQNKTVEEFFKDIPFG